MSIMSRLLSKCYRADESMRDLQNFADKNKEYKSLVEKYLPEEGQGENMAEQAVTAVCKLGYKLINDGDMVQYDGRSRGGNDLSSYANWLYKNVPATKDTMEKLTSFDEDEYAEVILELTKIIFNKDLLSKLEGKPVTGSIYDCDGPFEEGLDYDDDDEYSVFDRDDYDESCDSKSCNSKKKAKATKVLDKTNHAI